MNAGLDEEVLKIVKQQYDVAKTYLFVNRSPNLAWGI